MALLDRTVDASGTLEINLNLRAPQLAGLEGLMQGFLGAFLGAAQNYAAVQAALDAVNGRLDIMATKQEQLTALVEDLQRIETAEEANVSSIQGLLTANTAAVQQLDEQIAQGTVDQATLDLLSTARDLFDHNNAALAALVPQAAPAQPAPTDPNVPAPTDPNAPTP